MRSPRGFGKNYFTFSSVLAHSVAPLLQSHVSQVRMLPCQTLTQAGDVSEEDDPPQEMAVLPCSRQVQPCYCNGFYELKTRLALLLNLFIPRCPYYTTYFAFRRTGVHPPLFF
ncbi:MAG: hypothetical protein DSZ03_07295 [Sulfurimonas sp.]|nr:MAG: hypothetical protein DSZ03_07295 [Sulfurimonas sp.]